MDRAIFVALSGAVLQEKRLDTLADNLANVNTAGFKSQKPVFAEAMPEPDGPRSFAIVRDVVSDMSQGTNMQTGSRLDLALSGDGFFVIKTPGGNRYTRDGSFTLAKDGTLVTREGYPVLGKEGVIKLTSSDVVIDESGNVEERGIVVDALKLASVNNQRWLRREGNFFAPAGALFKAGPVDPNTRVRQGYVEVSNVNAVKAMTAMIDASRSYETHVKLIQTIDEMTRKSIDEVGRGR